MVDLQKIKQESFHLILKILYVSFPNAINNFNGNTIFKNDGLISSLPRQFFQELFLEMITEGYIELSYLHDLPAGSRISDLQNAIKENKLLSNLSFRITPKGMKKLTELDLDPFLNELDIKNAERIQASVMKLEEKIDIKIFDIEKILKDHEIAINSYYVKIIEIFAIFVALFSFIGVSFNLFSSIPLHEVDNAFFLIQTTIVVLTFVIIILLLSIRLIIMWKPPWSK